MFFFRRVISDESFILGFFLEGKGYTIELGQLGNPYTLALMDGTPFNWAACFDIFFQNAFSGKFCQRRLKFCFFFWNRFDIHHCPVHFSTSTIFERICRILRLFAHLHGQGRSWPGLKFLAAEIFCRRVFGKNNWKPSFLESKCYLVALVFYREQVLLCCLSSDFYRIYGIPKLVRPWSISCSQFLTDPSVFFHRILAENFCGKNDFSKKIQLHLRFSAFGMPESEAYRMSWGTD